MTTVRGFMRRIYWRLLRFAGFKSDAWDDQFNKGLWKRGRHSDAFIDKVISLSQGGVVVEFGCAEGRLPEDLPQDSFSTYFGYDISSVAVRAATERAMEAGVNNRFFQQCDMSQWQGGEAISLIVLEECLYYLNAKQIRVFLERCKNSLKVDGRILVVVHSASKHAKTLAICRSVCHVIEDVFVDGRTYLTLGRTDVSSDY